MALCCVPPFECGIKYTVHCLTKTLQEMCFRYAEEELLPTALEVDQTHTFPKEKIDAVRPVWVGEYE
jgi:hypothetical protein